MPFNQNEIARANVFYTMPDGVEAITRFTAQQTSASTVSDADALLDWTGQLDDLYTNVVPDIADTVTIDRYELAKVTVVASEEVLEFIGVGTVTPQPANANEMLPHGVCMLFSARLSGAGRGSARIFLPGFTEAAAAAGIWLPAVIVAMAPAIVDWATTFGVGNRWNPGTHSALKGFRTMILPQARNIPAYQIRRKPGVGS